MRCLSSFSFMSSRITLKDYPYLWTGGKIPNYIKNLPYQHVQDAFENLVWRGGGVVMGPTLLYLFMRNTQIFCQKIVVTIIYRQTNSLLVSEGITIEVNWCFVPSVVSNNITQSTISTRSHPLSAPKCNLITTFLVMIFLINFLCSNIGAEISTKRIKLQLNFTLPSWWLI